MYKITQDQYEHLVTWINALKQNPPKTEGKLKTEQGMCCLGVAADIVPENLWVDIEDYSYASYGDSDDDDCILPKYHASYYGMPRAGFLIPTSLLEKYSSVDIYI